jgi:cell division protein FtsB
MRENSYPFGEMSRRQNSHLRQRKTLLGVLFVLCYGLLYGILLGDHGLRRYLELRETLAARSTQAYDSIVRNRRLFERVQALRTNDRALEETARKTLGVVRDNEIVYVFEPPDGGSR